MSSRDPWPGPARPAGPEPAGASGSAPVEPGLGGAAAVRPVPLGQGQARRAGRRLGPHHDRLLVFAAMHSDDRAARDHGLLDHRHAADHPVRGARADRPAGRDEHGRQGRSRTATTPAGCAAPTAATSSATWPARSTAWRTTWRRWTPHRKELVANVSHELRTPIAALRAVLENVVDGVSAADPETMRTALKQTERLGRLVETLLDLSRLDNGVVPLHARALRGLAVSVRGAQGGQHGRGARGLPRARASTPVRTSICTSTSRRRS